MTSTIAITISKLITKALVRRELCEEGGKNQRMQSHCTEIIRTSHEFIMRMGKTLCVNMNLL